MAELTFPRWMFHKEHGGRIFQSPEAVSEAGEGWQATHFPGQHPHDVQPAETEKAAAVPLPADESANDEPPADNPPKSHRRNR